MSELDFIAKYGPTGILGLLLIGAGRVALKVIDRWFALSDKIEAALDRYMETIRQQEVAAERRHSETREKIESGNKETRHSIRQSMQVMGGALETKLDQILEGHPTRPISRGIIDVEPED